MLLPRPRGAISDRVISGLRRGALTPFELPRAVDPVGDDDWQLALWVCYELSYRGFDHVADDAEWDAGMLAVRGELEHGFLAALRDRVPVPHSEQVDGRVPPPTAERLRDIVDGDDGPSLSRYLERQGSREQFEEFVIHRSLYQLKEADPHSWGIPRLSGPAKAALVTLQYGEYGEGLPSRMHSELFRTTMRELGLDDSYGAYIDVVPGCTLATSNVITLFGLHRSLRGALVGHLAAFEMTSSQPSRRYSRGLHRLGGSSAARRFYDEHVSADALHEQLAAHDICARMVAAEEPALADDVAFGAACCLYLDAELARHLLDRWKSGASSLLQSGRALNTAS